MFQAIQQAAAATPAVANQFHLDSGYWQGLVALAALVLSQLPPVRIWFKQRRLDIDVPEEIVVTHKVGNPNIYLLVALRNKGGRPARVTGIYMQIRRENGDWFRLDAYRFENPGLQGQFVMMPFEMAGDSLWVRNYLFYKNIERQDDQIFRRSKQALLRRIHEIRKERGIANDSAEIVSVEAEYAEPFRRLFDKQFRWQVGQYEVELVVEAEPDKATARANYRFALFESDVEVLREHVEEFETGGAGITWKGNRDLNVVATLSKGK